MNIEKIWHGLQSSCAHRNSLAIHMLSLKIGYTYEYTPKMTISKRLNYGFTIHFLAVPTFFFGPSRMPPVSASGLQQLRDRHANSSHQSADVGRISWEFHGGWWTGRILRKVPQKTCNIMISYNMISCSDPGMVVRSSWSHGGSLSNLDQPAMVMIALDPRFLSIEGVKIAINRHSGDGSIAESLEPCEAVDAWKKIFESCSKLLNISIKTRHLRNLKNIIIYNCIRGRIRGEHSVPQDSFFDALSFGGTKYADDIRWPYGLYWFWWRLHQCNLGQSGFGKHSFFATGLWCAMSCRFISLGPQRDPARVAWLCRLACRWNEPVAIRPGDHDFLLCFLFAIICLPAHCVLVSDVSGVSDLVTKWIRLI